MAVHWEGSQLGIGHGVNGGCVTVELEQGFVVALCEITLEQCKMHVDQVDRCHPIFMQLLHVLDHGREGQCPNARQAAQYLGGCCKTGCDDVR